MIDLAGKFDEAFPRVAGIGAAGFDDFFIATREEMVRLAALLTGSASAAEDVVQEVFVNVLTRWDRLETPLAYTRRAVVNRSNSFLRQLIRARSHQRNEAQGREGSDVPMPELADLLRQLPKQRRAVVVLRFYLQLSVPEIAGLLNVSEGTVKSTLHRALQQLKGMMA